MKRFYLLLSIILTVMLYAPAQNAHWSYEIPTPGIIASSAVTVILSNGSAYIAQTQSGTSNIHLSEIDPASMAATGTTYTYANASTTYNNIILKGGFEDFDGNIVLYGYCFNSGGIDFGYIAEINPNNYFQINYAESSTSNQMIAGCSGFDTQGNVTNTFISNDGILHVFQSTNILESRKYGQQGYYTDVVWDRYNDCFVASGSRHNTTSLTMDPLISCFKFDAVAPSIINLYDYAVRNGTITGWSEGKSQIAILDDHHLALYQDLRKGDYDIIWLTLVKGHAAAAPIFPISTYFLAPVHKLSVYDMVYDEYNNRLNLLGMFNYCSQPTTFLAQTDPFNLSYLNMRQIASMYGNATCTTWDIPIQTVIGNDVRLNNITLNPFNPCSTTVSTGIAKNSFGTTPYLTETFDIQQSNCDMPFKVLTSPCTPNTSTTQTTNATCSFQTNSINPIILYQTYAHVECADPISCTKHQENDDYANTKSSMFSKQGQVVMKGPDHFICLGFKGNINYEIIDVLGRLIDNGETMNEKSNFIPTNISGIYILRCSDDFGNKYSTKIALTY